MNITRESLRNNFLLYGSGALGAGLFLGGIELTKYGAEQDNHAVMLTGVSFSFMTVSSTVPYIALTAAANECRPSIGVLATSLAVLWYAVGAEDPDMRHEKPTAVSTQQDHAPEPYFPLDLNTP